MRSFDVFSAVSLNKPLTHWGRVTHMCVSKLTIIGSDNGLSPGRRQAIIWTNAVILLIGPLGTDFSENVIEIYTFSFKTIHLKMSSAKMAAISSRPQCVKEIIELPDCILGNCSGDMPTEAYRPVVTSVLVYDSLLVANDMDESATNNFFTDSELYIKDQTRSIWLLFDHQRNLHPPCRQKAIYCLLMCVYVNVYLSVVDEFTNNLFEKLRKCCVCGEISVHILWCEHYWISPTIY